MKTNFTRLLATVVVMVMGFICGQDLRAQTGVLNYQDPIVIYNPAAPPTMPPANTLKKWVKTNRVSYNTNDFKAYIFNDVQFRLKWPKSYTPTADGKLYPLYLFFHGVGEAGTWYDNEFQFSHGGNVHQAAVNNGTYDGFLLYPQSANASGGWNQQQIDAIAQLITNYLIPEQKVDPNRICVNGLSGGGDATWQFSETHPTMAACFIPMSSANISDESFANTLKYTPIWLFQGGLDKSPDPSTTIQIVNAYTAVGGNLKYTIFPNDGHNTWDDTWKQADYFPFMLRAYQSNPWVLTGKNQFCPGTTVSGTIGVVGGFTSYQWMKDGILLSNTTNSIPFSATGSYSCRILQGSTWSQWSPIPMVVSIKAPTVSPNISVSGLASDVLPAPDGSTSVSLTVPTGYVSYTWERVDSPAGHPTILSNTTNTLTGATPGQYAVEVTEQFGCSSSFSTSFTVEKTNGPTPPQAPTGLLATALSKTQIKLTWSENAAQPNPETQFEIYQSLSADGPFHLIGFSNAGVDSFNVNGLTPKTTTFYLVRAINATAGSATAGPSSAQTQADVTPPTAPANLKAGTITGTSVQLIWTPSTDDVGVTNYDIYVNGNLTSTVGNIDTFVVGNLVNGKVTDFTIKARDFAGNSSPFSNQLASTPITTNIAYSYTPGTWTTLPNFNNLVPTKTGTMTNIAVSFGGSARSSFGFLYTGNLNITTAGAYTFQITSVDGSAMYIDVPYSVGATPTVINDGVHASTTVTGPAMTLAAGPHTFAAVYFKGSSTNPAAAFSIKWKAPGSSTFVAVPNSAFVETAVTGGTPAAPSLLTATAASAKKINLGWQDNSTNETGFQVFRSTTTNGVYAAIATVKPGRTSYSDSTGNPSTAYFYKIQAIDGNGSSAFSNTATATTQALPPVPSDPNGLAGTAQGPTHSSLTWNNTANNANGFEVWRSPVSNTNYVLAATLPVVTSFADSNLLNNTTYFYKVRAFNEGGTSNFSNEISLTTSGQAVTTVTLTPVANQSMVNDTTTTLSVSAGSSSVGAAIVFTIANQPSFVTLADNHNGTGTLTLSPNSTQLGTFSNIILTATDAFGGSSSDTFSVAVNGRNLKTVQVTMNVNNNPVSGVPGWNAMNVNGAVAGVNVTNFTDVNGNATTEGISLISSWDGAYATGMNTGNNSGIYPDVVLRNFYFGSTFNNYSFKVTGLSSTKKYALVFFAGYPWGPTDVATYGNMITNYTVGSQTVTLNVANNISNTVQLSGLSPDGTGAITVTINKPIGSAYCLINDLQILSYDAPQSVAALIPPSKLVANGASASSVNLNWVNSPDTRTGLEIWRSTNPAGTFSLLAAVGGNATTYTDANLPLNSTYFYEVREVVNTTNFSAFSNIAGGSTIRYTVNVSLNSQTTGSQPLPWNDMNFLLTPGTGISNMVNTNNQPTGIGFNLVRDFTSFNDQLGLTTGNNSGVVPDNVMKTFYYDSQGDTSVVAITGLPKTGIFNFGFFAATNFSNAPTVGDYQIGNQVVALNAFNNTTNMVFINGVKPDSTGTVYITFYTDASTPYAMWTSLTIQGMTSPDVIAADSAGTAGTIATSIKTPGVVSGSATTMDANTLTSSSTANRFAAGLSAFPNPFVDNVTVNFDFQQNVAKFTLVVVDVAGRILQKQEFNSIPAGFWQHNLNLGNLNKGVYFIQGYGLPGDKPASFRLVKVK